MDKPGLNAMAKCCDEGKVSVDTFGKDVTMNNAYPVSFLTVLVGFCDCGEIGRKDDKVVVKGKAVQCGKACEGQ